MPFIKLQLNYKVDIGSSGEKMFQYTKYISYIYVYIMIDYLTLFGPLKNLISDSKNRKQIFR